MRIVVASGKGGVGKSTISASLALLFARDYDFQLLDADVDCPDLHLLFPGHEVMSKPVYLSKKAEIDFSKCSHCMICYEKCPFNAIDVKLRVDPILCEGCGLCAHMCPEKAITLKPQLTGYLRKIQVNYSFQGNEISFPFIYGELEPGQSNSGKLVDELKKLEEEKEVTLVDSAAGIGCPVIASVQGADLALLVTEPTPSALDDLIRISDLANHFQVAQALIINKADLSSQWRSKILKFAESRKIPVIGELPFHDSAFEALSQGKPVVATSSPLAQQIEEIYNNLLELVEGFR